MRISGLRSLLVVAVLLGAAASQLLFGIVRADPRVPASVREPQAGVCPEIVPGSSTAVNVRTDAGAKGDGATDDSAAFKLAVARLAAAGGGTLIVPSGTYLISPAAFISIPSGVTVRADAATLRADQYGYALLGVGGTNICVAGLTVDGNNQVVRGIELGPAENVSIEHGTVENISQPRDPSVPGYVNNAQQVAAGIRIEGNGSRISVLNSTIRNVVSVNTTPGGTVVPARGVWITPAAGQSMSTHVTLAGDTFYEVGPKDDGDCVVIQGAPGATAPADLSILDSSFDRCHKRAIKIQWPDVLVAGNQIHNPFHGDNTSPTDSLPEDMYAAISVYASQVAVFGNSVSGPGNFYVAVELGADPCLPLQNIGVLYNDIAMGNVTAGTSLVRIMAPLDQVRITHNRLANAPDGIVLFPGSTDVLTAPNTYVNVANHVRTYGTPCAAGSNGT